MKRAIISLSVVLSLFLNTGSAFAMGILNACEGSSFSGSECFAKYPTGTNLIYQVDPGALGSFTSAEAFTILNDILAKWNAVGSSNFVFQLDPSNNFLSADVDENNFQSFLSVQDQASSPVIWDEDGDIVEALGAGKSATLGFAGPVTVARSNSNQDFMIFKSEALMNGFLFTVGSSTKAQVQLLLESTILHELGHAIGLDHTQTHVDLFNNTTNGANSVPGTPSDDNDVPIMFPIAANLETDLKDDDIGSLGHAYPSSTFNSTRGIITGQVRDSSNNVIQGVTVTAHNTASPFVNAVSSASDILDENDGTYLVAVVPGSYKLRLEKIDSNFVSGSSVGPHLPNSGSVAVGYYNGENADLVTGFNSVTAGTVSVTAGQTVTANFGGTSSSGGGNTGSGGDDNSGSGGDDNTGSNEPQFDTSLATSKVKFRRKRDKFRVTLRVPKIVNRTRVRVDVETSDDFFGLINIKKDFVRSGKKSKRIKVKFTARAEDLINEFPGQSTVTVPITLIDFDTGFEGTANVVLDLTNSKNFPDATTTSN